MLVIKKASPYYGAWHAWGRSSAAYTCSTVHMPRIKVLRCVRLHWCLSVHGPWRHWWAPIRAQARSHVHEGHRGLLRPCLVGEDGDLLEGPCARCCAPFFYLHYLFAIWSSDYLVFRLSLCYDLHNMCYQSFPFNFFIRFTSWDSVTI
jgi:hypothetical protein